MKSTKAAKPDPSIAAVIIDDLEEGIVSGVFAPGVCLPGEETLRRKFGCSRPAIREALQNLKARGLVVSRRGSGSYVAEAFGAKPVRESLRLYSSLQSHGRSYLELLDLRLMIESFCVLRLAGDDGREARKTLRQKLTVMKGRSKDLKAFGEADIAFHLALVEGARHDLFTNIMRGLLSGLGVRFAKETYLEADLVAKTLQDHLAICQALESGDAALARRRLRLHLEHSRRHLQKMLGNHGADVFPWGEGHPPGRDE